MWLIGFVGTMVGLGLGATGAIVLMAGGIPENTYTPERYQAALQRAIEMRASPSICAHIDPDPSRMMMARSAAYAATPPPACGVRVRFVAQSRDETPGSYGP